MTTSVVAVDAVRPVATRPGSATNARSVELAQKAIAIVMAENDTDADSAAALIRVRAARHQVTIMEAVELIVLIATLSSSS